MREAQRPTALWFGVVFFFFVKKKSRKILKGLGGTMLQQLNLRIYYQRPFAFWILLTMSAWRAGVMFIAQNILLVQGSGPGT